MIQQTPWIERSFQFHFDTGLFPVIFSRLEGSIFRLHVLLNTEDEILERKEAGWSVKEHAGHLLDMEATWWQRLQDFNEGKAELSPADMTNRKTEEARHNERPVEEILQAFSLERQKLLEAVYDFDKTALSRSALHPRLRIPMRVIDSLFFVAEHDDHHIAAISNLLRKPVG